MDSCGLIIFVYLWWDSSFTFFLITFFSFSSVLNALKIKTHAFFSLLASFGFALLLSHVSWVSEWPVFLYKPSSDFRLLPSGIQFYFSFEFSFYMWSRPKGQELIWSVFLKWTYLFFKKWVFSPNWFPVISSQYLFLLFSSILCVCLCVRAYVRAHTHAILFVCFFFNFNILRITTC